MDHLWKNPCKHGNRLDFGHVGGTSDGGDPDSWFPELWDWLIKSFSLASMLDVGCGIGYTQSFFFERGLTVFGIDGSAEVLKRHCLPACTEVHDLTTGVWLQPQQPDLVWCCEVAEHVEEKFVQNVIDTLVQNCGKVLAFSAAPKGAGGYHHVNCQDPDYWAEKFMSAGLVYRQELTMHGRKISQPGQCGRSASYFQRSGLIFTR